MNNKLPAIQFYPNDWRGDIGVQSLSYHDKGVWIEVLCLMHSSEQRGKLLLNGKPMPIEVLARLLALDKQNLEQTLQRFVSYGVASIDEDTGALMNRRMVRDEHIRQVRKEAGAKGGNPNLLNQNHKQNGSKPPSKKQPLHLSSSTSKKKVGTESPPTETDEQYFERKQREYPKLNIEKVFADFLEKIKLERYSHWKPTRRYFDKWLAGEDVPIEIKPSKNGHTPTADQKQKQRDKALSQLPAEVKL